MADNALSVHPTLAKLAEAAKRDLAVELQGYVGPAPPDAVRLHPDFAMASYIEVAKQDVLHAEPVPDAKDGRIRLWVAASATITKVCVHHTPARDYIRGAECRCPTEPDITALPVGRTRLLRCAILRAIVVQWDRFIQSSDFQSLSQEEKNRVCETRQDAYDTLKRHVDVCGDAIMDKIDRIPAEC